jgi:hypothetical protein
MVDVAVLGPERVAHRAVVEFEQIIVEEPMVPSVQRADALAAEHPGHRVVHSGVHEEKGALATRQRHALEVPGEVPVRIQEQAPRSLHGSVQLSEAEAEAAAGALELLGLFPDPAHLLFELEGRDELAGGQLELAIPVVVREQAPAHFLVGQ